MMGERELVGLAGLFLLFILIGLRIPVALSMLVAGILGSFALSIAAPFLKFRCVLPSENTGDPNPQGSIL